MNIQNKSLKIEKGVVNQAFFVSEGIYCYVNKTGFMNLPWWLSGLICHVSNSSRDRRVDPGLNSARGIFIYGTVMDPLCIIKRKKSN